MYKIALLLALLACACQAPPTRVVSEACEIRSQALCDLAAVCYGWTDPQTETCIHEAETYCEKSYLDSDRAMECAVEAWDLGCPMLEAYIYPDACY